MGQGPRRGQNCRARRSSSGCTWSWGRHGATEWMLMHDVIPLRIFIFRRDHPPWLGPPVPPPQTLREPASGWKKRGQEASPRSSGSLHAPDHHQVCRRCCRRGTRHCRAPTQLGYCWDGSTASRDRCTSTHTWSQSGEPAGATARAARVGGLTVAAKVKERCRRIDPAADPEFCQPRSCHPHR